MSNSNPFDLKSNKIKIPLYVMKEIMQQGSAEMTLFDGSKVTITREHLFNGNKNSNDNT